MNTNETLAKLGVTPISLQKAGNISGLMESIELLESSKTLIRKRIQEYSLDISSEIAEMLLERIKPNPDSLIALVKKYLEEKLIGWINSAMMWTTAGVMFGETSYVKIPK